MDEIRYFSMFSGIGGFELGIQRAMDCGAIKEKREQVVPRSSPDSSVGLGDGRRSSPLCIGYSEIDKYAIKVYERWFDHENRGNATEINPGNLPDFDLLVGGFPCQAFSVAGKRGGFDDTRGTLFFEIARVLKEKRPRHFLLENVKGLLSHDKGKTYQTMLGVLSDLGYRVEWQILNSKHYGVPQNRERIFIIGHLRGECGRKVFPLIGGSGEDIKRLGHMPGYRRYNQTYYADGAVESMDTSGGGGHQPCVGIDLSTQKSVTTKNARSLQARYHKGYSTRAAETTGVMVKEATKKGYAVAKEGDSINVQQPGSKTRRGRVGKGEANTLDTSMHQATLDGMKIRRLTPLECERLQGFPDNWTAIGKDEDGNDEEISDTQRYKMCGNAVTVNVIEAIVSEMKGCLHDQETC